MEFVEIISLFETSWSHRNAIFIDSQQTAVSVQIPANDSVRKELHSAAVLIICLIIHSFFFSPFQRLC